MKRVVSPASQPNLAAKKNPDEVIAYLIATMVAADGIAADKEPLVTCDNTTAHPATSSRSAMVNA